MSLFECFLFIGIIPTIWPTNFFPSLNKKKDMNKASTTPTMMFGILVTTNAAACVTAPKVPSIILSISKCPNPVIKLAILHLVETIPSQLKSKKSLVNDVFFGIIVDI